MTGGTLVIENSSKRTSTSNSINPLNVLMNTSFFQATSSQHQVFKLLDASKACSKVRHLNISILKIDIKNSILTDA